MFTTEFNFFDHILNDNRVSFEMIRKLVQIKLYYAFVDFLKKCM